MCQFFVVQGQKILDKVATRLLGDNDNSNPQIPKTYKPNTTCCVAGGRACGQTRARAQAGRRAAVDGRTQAGQSAAAQQAQKSK